jgi:outer membrane protein assembly factor BamE
MLFMPGVRSWRLDEVSRLSSEPDRYNGSHHICTALVMPARPSLALIAALSLVVGLPLAGCSSGQSVLARPAQWITPYRPDVVQGNFIAAEQVAQLKPGLTRLQVRNLLGTPLVSSIFHADRWDYVFSLKRGSDARPRLYRYSVFFEADALVKFEGDAMPSENEFVAQFSQQQRKSRPVPALQATPEQLEAARASAAKSVEAAPSQANPAPATVPTSYPPLEGTQP